MSNKANLIQEWAVKESTGFIAGVIQDLLHQARSPGN